MLRKADDWNGEVFGDISVFGDGSVRLHYSSSPDKLLFGSLYRFRYSLFIVFLSFPMFYHCSSFYLNECCFYVIVSVLFFSNFVRSSSMWGDSAERHISGLCGLVFLRLFCVLVG